MPLIMTAMQVALAAGCTVSLKPAEQEFLSPIRLAEMALEASQPAGVLNLCTGRGKIAGAALVDDPRVATISFTGSTQVGRQIARTAAEQLKPVSLELGGKSPNIVFADADVEVAAHHAAQAIFTNSGQLCVAGSRLLIRIPILDSGFVRSDLTYDVAAVWEGRFFRLDDHLDRLLAGCEKLRLTPPVTREQIREAMIESVRKSGLRNAYVEAIVTRGIPNMGERDPRNWTSRFYAYAIPYVWIVAPEQQEIGTSVVIAQRTQRIPLNSVDPTVKNIHWGDLTRGLFEAYDRGAWVAVHPDNHGMITESAGFNVFAVVDDILRTPARGVLEGITRRTALGVARDHAIPLRRLISTADLRPEARLCVERSDQW